MCHTFMLSCAVIIAHQRTNALNDSAYRKVDKGLQLIICAKYQHVALSEYGEDAIDH